MKTKRIKVEMYKILYEEKLNYRAEIILKKRILRMSTNISDLAYKLEELSNTLGHKFDLPVTFNWRHPAETREKTPFNIFEIKEFLDNYKWREYFRCSGA